MIFEFNRRIISLRKRHICLVFGRPMSDDSNKKGFLSSTINEPASKNSWITWLKNVDSHNESFESHERFTEERSKKSKFSSFLNWKKWVKEQSSSKNLLSI